MEQVAYIPPLPSKTPMPYVTAPSSAPTAVISKPEDHQERTVISDLAAPTAKWAAREMTAAAMTAWIPCMKKKGMMGMVAPTAVESAPELAETMGLESASSEVPSLSPARTRSICSGSAAMWLTMWSASAYGR